MTAHEIEALDKADEKRKTPNGLTDLILKSLQDLDFGSVEIIVHESKVVQIERREKFRLPKHHA